MERGCLLYLGEKILFLGDLLKIICIGDLLLHLHFLKHFFLDIRDWMGYMVEMLYDSSNR